MIAGEVWWGGQWVPSCQACARALGGLWRETIRPGICDGCAQVMASIWTDRNGPPAVD